LPDIIRYWFEEQVLYPEQKKFKLVTQSKPLNQCSLFQTIYDTYQVK